MLPEPNRPKAQVTRVEGSPALTTSEMRLLFSRLERLKEFVGRYKAGYAGFKATVLAVDKRLGIGRLEFTRESLAPCEVHEEIADGLTLHRFQGDASLMSSFPLEVTDMGLQLHMPGEVVAEASTPQCRSLIQMSSSAEIEYGLAWSIHSVEAWTPAGRLPALPEPEALEQLRCHFYLDVAKHWGNLLLLMPCFGGRLPAADRLGWELEAVIEYDSRLIKLDDLVLVREIWEAGNLWDREANAVSSLIPINADELDDGIPHVAVKDLATGRSLSCPIPPIHGDGGDSYRILLTARGGQLLDARTVPLLNSYRFDIEVGLLESSVIKNPRWKHRERSSVDPNRPWKERLPRDRFLGRPGLWLTRADPEEVAKLLELLAAQALEYVKIVDPYAGVDLLTAFVARLPNNIGVRLITSRIDSKGAFLEKLRELRSHGYRIQVLRIHREEGPSGTPLHDRFVVTRGAGWYLGTSFNSLAKNASLVAELTPADAAQLEAQFDGWWANDVRGRDAKACTKEPF